MVSLQSIEGEQTTHIATRLNEVKDTCLVQTVGLSTIKQAHARPREKSVTFVTNTITLLKYVGQKWERKYTQQ